MTIFSNLRIDTFPLVLSSLFEQGEVYERGSAQLYAMARACMGSDITLYSWNKGDKDMTITFAWSVPNLPIHYGVNIKWQRVGLFYKPDSIITALCLENRTRQEKEGLWTIGFPLCSGICDKDKHPPGSISERLVDLAKKNGTEKFLKTRWFSFTHKNLREKLREVSKEYNEEITPFMVASIFVAGDFFDDNIIADFQKISLPMVRRIYPQTIANRITSVQPMKSPQSMIYYMRYKHGTGKAWEIQWWLNKYKKLKETISRIFCKALSWIILQAIKVRLAHPGPSWLVQKSDIEATRGFLP